MLQALLAMLRRLLPSPAPFREAGEELFRTRRFDEAWSEPTVWRDLS